MAPKAALAGPAISAADAAILAAVIGNMKGTLDTDWEAVTKTCNLKNVSTTRTRFGQVKRKLMAVAAANNGVAAPDDAANAAGDDDDALLSLESQPLPKTPAKKRKATSTKASKKRKIKEENVSDEDGAGDPATPIDKIMDESSILEDTPETPAKHSAKKPKNETPKLNPAFNISVAQFTSGYDDDNGTKADGENMIDKLADHGYNFADLVDYQQYASQ